MAKLWDARTGDCLLKLNVNNILYSISFGMTDLYFHTEIGIINISALSSLQD